MSGTGLDKVGWWWCGTWCLWRKKKGRIFQAVKATVRFISANKAQGLGPHAPPHVFSIIDLLVGHNTLSPHVIVARSPEIIFRSRPPNTCAFAYPLHVLQATVSTWAWNVVGKNKNNNFSKDLRFIMRSKLKKKINFCPSLSRHLIVDNPVSEILIWRMKKKNDCIHHYP